MRDIASDGRPLVVMVVTVAVVVTVVMMMGVRVIMVVPMLRTADRRASVMAGFAVMES
jgi:hypothetical protein